MTLLAKESSVVAYWPLTEASGNAIDDVGSLDLTDNNTVGTGTGKFGNARDFEAGDSEYLSIADNATLSMGDVTFMLRCWVNLESKSADMRILNKWTTAGNREYRLFYQQSTDRFVFEVRDTGNTATATVTANNFGSPSTGNFYLLHAWHDATGNEIGIAVNAGTADTASTSGGVRDGAAAFVIGSNGSLEFFDGLICDAFVMKSAFLDATERAEDYNSGSGISFADWRSLSAAVAFAVAHWPLDEASGARIDSIGGLSLTDNNTVGSAAGKFGNAADFERSSSEYLSIADNATLSMGDIDFTIRCWAKLESKPGVDMQIFTKMDFAGSSDYRLIYDATSNRFLFNVSHDGSSVVNLFANNFGEPSLDTWYLIHCWHDSVANLLGISVNAGTANTVSHSTGVFNGNASFGIGGNAALATQMFDGMVDDLVILKGYVLSAAERTEDYNGGTGIAFEDWGGGGGGGLSIPIAMYHYKRLMGV